MDKFEVQWARTATNNAGFPYAIHEAYREYYPNGFPQDALVILRAFSTKPYRYTGTYPPEYEVSAEVSNMNTSNFRALAVDVQKVMLKRAIKELGLSNVSHRRTLERVGEFIR